VHGPFLEEAEDGELEHGVLVEASAPEVGLVPGAELESADLEQLVHGDPAASQAVQVPVPVCRVDDVEGLLAALDALAHEGEHDPVLFRRGVEEGTDVSVPVERGSGEADGLGGRVVGPRPGRSGYHHSSS
jgi:hypothetical protein